MGLTFARCFSPAKCDLTGSFRPYSSRQGDSRPPHALQPQDDRRKKSLVAACAAVQQVRVIFSAATSRRSGGGSESSALALELWGEWQGGEGGEEEISGETVGGVDMKFAAFTGIEGCVQLTTAFIES